MKQITKQTKFKADLIDSIEVRDNDNRLIGYGNKYKITISYQKRKGTFEFTDSVQNTNEGNEPKKEDVMSCLVMDYTSDMNNFEDFCNEFGYGTDSIKAEKIFKAVKKNAEKMQRIYGHQLEPLCKEYENY